MAEGDGLLNRYTGNSVSGVRIPLSPPLHQRVTKAPIRWIIFIKRFVLAYFARSSLGLLGMSDKTYGPTKGGLRKYIETGVWCINRWVNGKVLNVSTGKLNRTEAETFMVDYITKVKGREGSDRSDRGARRTGEFRPELHVYRCHCRSLHYDSRTATGRTDYVQAQPEIPAGVHHLHPKELPGRGEGPPDGQLRGKGA